MSLQGISAITNPYLYKTQSGPSAMGSEFKNLASALQSGDLADAQDAFSQIQSLIKNMQNTQGAAGSQAAGIQNLFEADFDALGKALQSGDVKTAQDAFKKLQQDMQSAGKAHHRHHHHGGNASSLTVTSTTTVSGTTDSNQNINSSGKGVNVLL